MAVGGQVDGEHRSGEDEGDAVPGVRVLGTTMKEDELGWRVPPCERGYVPALFDLGRDSPYGRLYEFDAELFCILGEETELVIGGGVEPGGVCAARRHRNERTSAGS